VASPTPSDAIRSRRETQPAAEAEPVFVDASGRRRKLLRRASLIAVVAVSGYAVVLGLSFLGGPLPPNALLPIGGGPGSSAAGAPTGPGSTGSTRSAAPTNAATGGTVPGAAPSATNPAASLVKPSPSPSASSSPTGHKPTAPPGQTGKSATATAPGHGH
jgi:hypothetical protein